MKAFFYIVALILLTSLCIGSVGITVLDVVNNRYFKEFNNIKSLNNPEKYMDIDYLLIKQTFDRNEGTGDVIRFDIRGELLSDNSILTLKVGYKEYIDFSLEYQPLYKSKLTGYYFLKNAPEKYYDARYRGFYAGIFFKIAFYVIMPFLIYQLIKYKKNRIYRL